MTRERTNDFAVDGTPLAWSALDRDRELDRAAATDVDLVILGGGITGAGIAREAALRGIPFLLVDKDDFAAGTSSRSSKLVHGGMRYLAQRDFALVRESTTERNWLCAALPNLVRPIRFHYCGYLGGKDTPGRVRLALRLYDLLSNTFSRYRMPRHELLAPEELRRREPAVRAEGVAMAGDYYDANVDDARLTMEVLKEARDLSGGRSAALNYVEALAIREAAPGLREVDLRDAFTGRAFTVRARCVVNATGVWAGGTLARAGGPSGLIRPTKGVHLAVPNARVGNREAFVMRSLDDGRSFFVLRRGDITLIGTTDTDYQGPLEAPFCTAEDADYLLRTVNARFPEARLTRDDVLSTYAGIRPLVRQEGVGASSVSRRHVVRDEGGGLVTVAGGKLTTFRLMAWDVLRTCSARGYLRPLGRKEAKRHFSRRPLKAGLAWEAFGAALRRLDLEGLLPGPALRHLHQQYGQGALRILAAVKADPGSGRPILEGHPWCAAEIEHILAYENAPTLMDVMLRRTEMQMIVSHRDQPALAAGVARILARAYDWDQARTDRELADYLAYVRRTILFERDAHA
ncbi:glycerol-3-phosphate dehydrogenase/oxidase [Mesoterricola sediminis]|uniref:Glycerol-3-phosphate dehydrogenase n=1 Tax=Mesoterricola sediminis TaxID=2927980 RepID=A0AA48KBW9_9BACT|nr:glycerol-3-phosphate dehydrogenase/oxidase [Mesoterricola sediminis]BDU75515.1 glycerol-3-phosphate dehydrogenase [Mesoterricola sediminis]